MWWPSASGGICRTADYGSNRSAISTDAAGASAANRRSRGSWGAGPPHRHYDIRGASPGALVARRQDLLLRLRPRLDELGEVLRIYQDAGLVRVCGVRSEIEASHAAAALRWVRGEKAAVVTSIGPGALQALAASIVPRSDGLGVWYLLGDETTQDEGPNMQQIPGTEQNAFLRLFGTMSPGVLATHAAGACHRAAARTQRGGSSTSSRTVFLGSCRSTCNRRSWCNSIWTSCPWAHRRRWVRPRMRVATHRRQPPLPRPSASSSRSAVERVGPGRS